MAMGYRSPQRVSWGRSCVQRLDAGSSCFSVFLQDLTRALGVLKVWGTGNGIVFSV